jgi:hypothetical protein
VRLFQTHHKLNLLRERIKCSSKQIRVLRFWLLVESTACSLNTPKLQQLWKWWRFFHTHSWRLHISSQVKMLGNGVNFPSYIFLQSYDGLICRCFALWLPLRKFWVVIGGACCSQMATGFSCWSFVVVCVDDFETPGHQCETCDRYKVEWSFWT